MDPASAHLTGVWEDLVSSLGGHCPSQAHARGGRHHPDQPFTDADRTLLSLGATRYDAGGWSEIAGLITGRFTCPSLPPSLQPLCHG